MPTFQDKLSSIGHMTSTQTNRVITSISFSEYSQKDSRVFHMTMPASPFEKWVSKVIIAIILFPMAFLILYQVFAQLTYRWDEAFPFNIVQLNFFDPFIWKHVIDAIAIQGIIFFGAVTFRRYSFFKTILAIGLIIIICNLLLMIGITVMREDVNLFSRGGIAGLMSFENAVILSGYEFQSKSETNVYQYYGLSSSTLLYMLSLMCLLLSYLKFKEIEA